MSDPSGLHPARVASLFTPREQVFSLCVVSLAAKLAKVDGPVSRAEIDAFKRCFRIPPENARIIGRLFDQAASRRTNTNRTRASSARPSPTITTRWRMCWAGLFGVARADRAVNEAELQFLSRTARAFNLDGDAWERARAGRRGRPAGRMSPIRTRCWV